MGRKLIIFKIKKKITWASWFSYNIFHLIIFSYKDSKVKAKAIILPESG